MSKEVLEIKQIEGMINSVDLSRKNCFTIEDDTPSILLSTASNGMSAGLYTLKCITSTQDIPLSPRVFMERLSGEEQGNAQIRCLKTRYGWKATFWIPTDTKYLKIALTENSGEFQFLEFSLTKVSNKRNGLVQTLNLISERVRSPRQLFDSAAKVARAIKNGGIKQLKEDLATTSRVGGQLNGYTTWIDLYDQIDDKDLKSIQKRIDELSQKPVISIITPVYNPAPELLRAAIESVLSQYYSHWELCLANDCSTDPEIARIIDEYAEQDSRIKRVHRTQNGHISAASNSALELASGEFIAFLDHDDELSATALYHVAEAINKNPSCRLFYSDEDKIDLDGKRHDPYFKSDWNHDLLLSHNLFTHLSVYDKALIEEVGGLRSKYDGAQDYDLALRCSARLRADEICHIPFILYHWRVMPGSTALSSDEKPYAMLAGERALNDHLIALNIKAKAELIGIGFKVSYEIPTPAPQVSIIIPTRNSQKLVKQCVDSIYNKTSYPDFEIILVDNGSDDPEAIKYFQDLEAKNQIKLISDPRPFNYSALNNLAVAQSNAPVLCLLNNDIEVISDNWLEEMVSLVLQPNVGAVGAMLYYPDDTIQHAGVVMGLGGLAAHIHGGLERGTPGYVGRAALRQSLSAVTGACMVVSRDNYEKVSGLDEENLAVAYNDIDFCLKLQAIGKRNIWTPHAELYHHESASRGYENTPEKLMRFQKEADFMKKKWPDQIKADPAYSPNLTLNDCNFSLAFPPRISKPWRA